MDTLWNSKYSGLYVFTLFIAITFFLRLDTFFLSSYDWDESLYFLGAQSLLNGSLPYLEIWDHKPPMIFGVHALAIIIFGDSYIATRILSCIFISVGAFGLFTLIKREDKSLARAGYFAGIIYILSTLLNGGKAANSEIFYVPFIIYAFVAANIFIKNFHIRISWSWILLSGFMLGIATSINYLSSLYAIPLAIYLLVASYKLLPQKNSLAKHILRLAIFGAAGPIAIFSVILLVYFYNNAIDDFIYANLTANTTYIHIENQSFSIRKLIVAFADQFSGNWLTWIMALLAIFIVTPQERSLAFYLLLIAITWLLASTIAILISRLYWAHYFLQFNPGICILAGLILSKIYSSTKRDSTTIASLTITLLLVGGFYNPIKESLKDSAKSITQIFIHNDYFYGDTPRKIANYISKSSTEGAPIYIVDYNPIIHTLSNTKVLTKFVFPPFIIGKTSAKMLPIDAATEVKHILSKKPIYIIKKHIRPAPDETDDAVYNLISQELNKNYLLDKTIDGIDLYKLK